MWLSWWSWYGEIVLDYLVGSKSNHRCPSEGGAEEDHTHTEEKVMHRGREDRSDNLSQRCQQQMEAGIGKDQILS